MSLRQPTLSLFLLPPNPQEKLFDFICHLDPTSKPDEEQEQKTESFAPTDDQIEMWGIHIILDIYSKNETCYSHTINWELPKHFKEGWCQFFLQGVQLQLKWWEGGNQPTSPQMWSPWLPSKAHYLWIHQI